MDACDLVQYCLSKGGVTCVLGTCQGSTNWSSLATDYLTVNLVANPRYRRVICIDFSNYTSVERIEGLCMNWSKRRQSSTATSSNGGVLKHKLYVIPAKFDDATSTYVVDNAQNLECVQSSDTKSSAWENVLSEVRSATNSSALKANGNVAVVLLSMSEVVLTVGFAEARSFVRKLLTLLTEIGASSSGESGSGSTGSVNGGDGSGGGGDPSNSTISALPTAPQSPYTPCLLLPIHQSLHSPAVLLQLQSLASALVRVAPNSGTLSETVACEIQCIRRSSTGKISESTEMFTCEEGLLSPLKPLSTTATTSTTSGTAAAADADGEGERSGGKSTSASASGGGSGGSGVVGVTTLPGRPSTTSTTSTTTAPSTTPSSANAASVSAPVVPQRLITFDSTDPEFDEDSDPDADLDL